MPNGSERDGWRDSIFAIVVELADTPTSSGHDFWQGHALKRSEPRKVRAGSNPVDRFGE